MDSYKRIGEILTLHGVITQEQLDKALSTHEQSHRRFGEVAVNLGIVDEETVTRCLSDQFDLPIANLSKTEPTEYALGLLSASFAAHSLFLPVKISEHKLFAIVCDPLDLETLEKVASWTGLRPVISLASPGELSAKIADCYAIQAVQLAA